MKTIPLLLFLYDLASEKQSKMANEVLSGTLDWKMDVEDRRPVPNVGKKEFKLKGLEKYRIPSIHPKSIHLPKYSRINF